MNELIEPLARTAGIDGAVPNRPTSPPTCVLPDILSNEPLRPLPPRLSAHEPSELYGDTIKAALMGMVAARTPCPSHFA
ncbi:hypothetical protein ACQR1I_22705 [Bradyrhizobium sp. HKCCYLS2038]|uniref:hypothetical protein n=1 Tax=unclassified Bradyrhizobium TaxID=2631580 RepID=UPI003EBE42A6